MRTGINAIRTGITVITAPTVVDTKKAKTTQEPTAGLIRTSDGRPTFGGGMKTVTIGSPEAGTMVGMTTEGGAPTGTTARTNETTGTITGITTRATAGPAA